MNLKFIVEKLEDVPEQFRALYVKLENGKFQLQIDGAVDKSKLDEFRNNNIELQKQIDKFKGIDPAKHAELQELQRKLQEKELIEKGEIEQLVGLRVGTMKETLQGQIDQLTTTNKRYESQLGVLLIDNVIKSAAISAGVMPTAVEDVLLRARGVYSVENGEPVPKSTDGKVIYGTDGTKPMVPADWVKGLKKTAPHLFANSQGGGANGGNQLGGKDPSNMSAIDKISMGLQAGLGTGNPFSAGLPKE